MIHLNDRLFAVTLDSLRIVRDELRAKGLTGDECQQALDLLQSGVTPTTDGIRFEFVQPNPVIPEADFEAFCNGYIECALWADCMPYRDDDEHGGGEHLDDRPGVRAAMIERGQLRDFYDANRADLHTYVQERGLSNRDGYEHAGHDFWLTRVGHGAGFWDRGLGELGDRLSEAAKSYGSPDDHTPYDCGDGTFDV